MKPEKTDIELRSLRALIRRASSRYSKEFVWQDVTLTDEFQRCYSIYLERSKYEIEFLGSTAVITTPQSRNIFVPNQWFVIASYVVDVYEELYKYKEFFSSVSEQRGKKMGEYAKQLRDATTAKEKTIFSDAAKIALRRKRLNDAILLDTIEKLWRFVTDYSWWLGQKTIDRHDFHMSVILNMLNLVNVSQGYVADIVSAYANDNELRYLIRRADSFTVGLIFPDGYSIGEQSVDTLEEYDDDSYTHEKDMRYLGATEKSRIKINKSKIKEIRIRN